MDEYIKREDVKKVVCEGCNERFSEEPCEPPDCEILHAIKSVRAADVVPRAELKRLQTEAIKKFAEELKKHKIKPEFPWDDYYINESVIDDIAEKMKGGEG